VPFTSRTPTYLTPEQRHALMQIPADLSDRERADISPIAPLCALVCREQSQTRIASREIVPDDVQLTPLFLECFVAYRKASACFARVLKTPSWLFPFRLRSTISRDAMRYPHRTRPSGYQTAILSHAWFRAFCISGALLSCV
jgi:hypothetical protein